MKRALTGGTRDLKPQQLVIKYAQASATGKYVVTSVQTPISRLGQSYIVMEILKVFMTNPATNDGGDVANNGQIAVCTNNIGRATDDTATGASFLVDQQNAGTIAFNFLTSTTNTSGNTTVNQPVCWDMTDGAGNGFLVATDKLFLVSGQSGATTLTGGTVRILYRFYRASAEEFIGIVNSQTTAN